MKLEQYINDALYGCYSPGALIAIRGDLEKNERYGTILHESTHLAITSVTTLGEIGILCDLVRVYDTSPTRSAASEKYLGILLSKAFWVQEGAATATETFVSSMQKSVAQQLGTEEAGPSKVAVPRSYQKAAIDVASVAFPCIENQNLGNLSLSNRALMFTRAVQAVAIASMSPPITDDFIRGALEGHVAAFLEPLCAIWARFRTIMQSPKQDFIYAISQMLPKVLTEQYVNVDFKIDMARVLCEVSQLEYGEPMNVKELAGKYVPDLAEHVLRYDAKEAQLSDISHSYGDGGQHLIIPKFTCFNKVRLENLSTIDDLLRSYIIIPEVTIFKDEEPSIILHQFDKESNNVNSLWITHEFSSRQLLEIIVKRCVVKNQSVCSGIIVGLEILWNQLKHLLNNLPTVPTSLYGLAPDEIQNLERICADEHVELHRVHLNEGGICWNVVGIYSEEPCRMMNLNERCYVWVLMNGITAHLRWEIRYS